MISRAAKATRTSAAIKPLAGRTAGHSAHRVGLPRAGLWLGLALLIVIASYALTSWWIGRQVEAQLRESHTALAEALGIQHTLLHYERGIFSANAASQFEWRGPKGAQAEHRLRVEHQISHGPLPSLRQLGWVHIASSMLPPHRAPNCALQPKAQAASAVSAQTLLTYAGTLQLNAQILATQLEGTSGDGRNWLLDLQPATLKMALGRSLRSLQFSLHAHGLGLQHDGAELQINALKGEAQFTRFGGLQHSYSGHSSWSVEDLQTTSRRPAGSRTPTESRGLSRFGGLVVDLRTDEAEAPAQTIQLRAATQQAQFWSADYGPAQISLDLQGLHLPTWERLAPNLLALLSQPAATQAYALLPLSVQQSLREQVASLFAQGLQVQLRSLAFTTPDGESRLDGALAAPQLIGTDLAFLPVSLLAKAQLRLNLQLPLATLARWQGQAAMQTLLQLGWLTQRENAVHTAIDYRSGIATVNGRAANPAGLLRLLQ